ncbi:hypothetical protein DITRI_Ditri01bG0062500 [Diplodiscus trichospermus]
MCLPGQRPLRELLESMHVGKLDPEVAFLNASLIPYVFPMLAAAQKTLIAKSREPLTTQSLKRYGISDNSSYVLAARFNATPDEMKAVEKLINGREIDLEELEGRTDQAQIQKISGQELGLSTLADAITCRIAAREAFMRTFKRQRVFINEGKKCKCQGICGNYTILVRNSWKLRFL